MRKRATFSDPDIGRAQGHRPYDWLGIFGCDSPIRLSRWVGLTTDRLGVLDSLSRLPFLCFLCFLWLNFLLPSHLLRNIP